MVSPDAVHSVRAAPVIVAGAGPVGMTLALELASHGVASALVERQPSTTTFPKMDLTNARSMELLARLGLTDAIRRAGVGEDFSFDVIFASGLGGREYARWQLPGQREMRESIEAVNDGTKPRHAWQRISQERMEAVLMAHCVADPLIDVIRPWRVVEVGQNEHGVTARVVSGETGEERHLRAEYLVGCEGAHSVARQACGIGLEGRPDVAGTSCQVHFKSRDRETLHRFGQFWHLFLATEIGRVALIAQDEIDTWTMQASVPDRVTEEGIDPADFLRARTQSSLAVDRVLHHTLWRPQAVVAERYSDRRVFIAGDAAHQFIPTGGYGMNTGVADAVDIGWKLAAVTRGWAGPALLESYDAERRPVAIANRDWAVRNFNVHLEAAQIVGGNVGLLGASSPEAGALRARLAKHYEHQRGENESFGLELGYAYARSPVVVRDGQDDAEPGEVVPADPFVYQPQARPGARAPHVRVPDGSSPLDAFGRGLTLLELSEAAESIGDALASCAARLHIPFERLHIEDPTAREIYGRDALLVRPDGHVAWRANTGPADPEALLSAITGRRPLERAPSRTLGAAITHA
jgi:2-polyprenyl-6-methoxyphenol hydroxylase-like FAD-dependent oxidoreductase